MHRLYLAYVNLCLPVIGWIATGGDAWAYRYLLKGIAQWARVIREANIKAQ